MLPACLQTTRAASHRRWVLWLALWLALFGALAPTVSHAVNWTRGNQGPPIDICTGSGPRWMALPTTPDSIPGDPAAAAVLNHCPFCMLMAGHVAPPPQLHTLFFAASGHAGVPVSPSMAFLPAQVLAAAYPRGPPAL
ncbi:MAG: DUF2946 family protein [Polaromonas sp.]|nr:DUF2946 family protein [Polaromonas sp.]